MLIRRRRWSRCYDHNEGNPKTSDVRHMHGSPIAQKNFASFAGNRDTAQDGYKHLPFPSFYARL
jgi:hypothetical protein